MEIFRFLEGHIFESGLYKKFRNANFVAVIENRTFSKAVYNDNPCHFLSVFAKKAKKINFWHFCHFRISWVSFLDDLTGGTINYAHSSCQSPFAQTSLFRVSNLKFLLTNGAMLAKRVNKNFLFGNQRSFFMRLRLQIPVPSTGVNNIRFLQCLFMQIWVSGLCC